MTPNHDDDCAALGGLPDVCTCGAVFRSALSCNVPAESGAPLEVDALARRLRRAAAARRKAAHARRR
jgi:hypothetical protein